MFGSHLKAKPVALHRNRKAWVDGSMPTLNSRYSSRWAPTLSAAGTMKLMRSPATIGPSSPPKGVLPAYRRSQRCHRRRRPPFHHLLLHLRRLALLHLRLRPLRRLRSLLRLPRLPRRYLPYHLRRYHRRLLLRPFRRRPLRALPFRLRRHPHNRLRPFHRRPRPPRRQLRHRLRRQARLHHHGRHRPTATLTASARAKRTR